MQIFIHTLVKTFDKKNWKWLGGIPGIITIIGVIQPNMSLLRTCLFSWITFIGDNALTDSCFLFFCALLIWAFTCMTYYLAKYFWEWVHNVYVDSVWANTIVDLATAYSCIHELERQGLQLTEEKVALALSEFCNQIKTIFDRKTHSDCCVSIKVPIANYNATDHWECIHVKNIARDQAHLSERDTIGYKLAHHTIIGNTAFSKVVALIMSECKNRNVYLNNDIDSDSNYQTTSLIADDRNTIPYKSELVVPIIPSRYDNLNSIKFGGFLCIDSNKKNVFDDKRYDIPMTKGLADGLYSLTQTLIQIREQANG